MKRLTLFAALLSLISPAFAQSPAMADTMRSEGKIYVVVAILVVILLGLVAFLVFTDRKVSKIEKELENKGR